MCVCNIDLFNAIFTVRILKFLQKCLLDLAMEINFLEIPPPLDTNLEGFRIILIVIYNDASSSTVLSVELLLCQNKL